ncbi:hypothetical protein N180_15360 [Pedobacter antarcticus 4BY]|uniref:Polysaccharide pyruvyl transferase domain-containing protein n=2 Tax=Pedobacter antarcticus TaxID=34086 RepID=A0A081PE02_9SPHI|nr:polysaccharide pyruvyl transferase family protein [Pedobacter antarcticus]KEQ28925.1 hypothetical protein N180_15360 [Pedobacter antarcticus 4BY]SFF12915.1 Polysaccharide pyruvyl transferase family protein WcaK [Pedobacter antarcticus]
MVPSQKKYKNIISGGYGLFNFGDDALMYVLYKKFEKQFAERNMMFLCLNPTYLKKLVPRATVLPRLTRKSVTCDNFILGGGTLFYSFTGEKNKTRKSLASKVKMILTDFTLAVGKVLVKLKIASMKYEPDQYNRIYSLGIGLGPFDNGDDSKKMYAKNFCKEAYWLSVRDRKSSSYLEDWGIENSFFGADICFLPDIFELPKAKSVGVKKIGIVVRDWDKNENSYKDQIFRSLKDLRKEYDVTFIVFSKFSDVSWVETLEQKGERFICWNPNKENISDFLNVLNEFDLFITARYHGFIFASLLNIPSICIDIEPKLSLAHETFKSSSFLWSSPFKAESLIGSVNEIELNHSQIKKQLVIDVDRQVELSVKMFEEFETQLVN